MIVTKNAARAAIPMTCTFNGIALKRVIWLTTTTEASGFMRYSFRIVGNPIAGLEQILQLNASALLVLSSQEIEGKIVHYSADVHTGYEITIESKSSFPAPAPARKSPGQLNEV